MDAVNPPPSCPPSRRFMLPGRSLHLVDIENLVGRGRASRCELASAAAIYLASAPVATGDLVIVGCDRGLRLNVGLAWPRVRVVGGTGKDGAETALLADIKSSPLSRRFRQVVIGSGDHAFAELARDLRRLGTIVGVVSPVGALAKELAVAASWTQCFAPLAVAA